MAKYEGNEFHQQYYISKKVVGSWPKGWQKLNAKGWGYEDEYDPKANKGRRPRRKPEPKK